MKKTVKDLNVKGKRVLLRVDFNVPLENGEISDDTRIREALPTINYLLQRGAKLIIASHLGRPKGKVTGELRLDKVAKRLEQISGYQVEKVNEVFSSEIKEKVMAMKPGQIIVLENLRFSPGEEENNPEFSRDLASLAEIYVDDAFGAVHRTHASVVGVTRFLPSVAGFLLEKEIEALSKLLQNTDQPFLAILGGSKVSDKIGVITNLIERVNKILIGGGMCFTFLKSQGLEIGNSIFEAEFLKNIGEVMEKAKKRGVIICLPKDIIVADRFAEDAQYRLVEANDIPAGWMGLDIGTKTIEKFKEKILKAKTIFWNGPMGVFEWENFAHGTREIALSVAESKAYSVVGGGETVSAIKKYNLQSEISHISSGGGASLEFIEGKKLPGIEVLPEAG